MKKLMSKEFVYNDNEVCINPNEILMMEKPKDWSQPFFLLRHLSIMVGGYSAIPYTLTI